MSDSATKTRVPAVEGLFTMEDPPHLIGGRGRTRGSYHFPKDLSGNDPANAMDDDRDQVLLSRTGKVWSFTTSHYPPPLPYRITEPYEPFVMAAVELQPEALVVLGQMVPDVALEDMHIGMEVELVLGTLYEDEDHEYVVWKWKPTEGQA